MKVAELSPGSRRVDIRLRILSIEPPRDVQTRYGPARVTTALAGDETGTVKLSLWNEDVDRIDENAVVDIHNGFVKSFRGELELSSGKFGELATVEDLQFPSRERITGGETKAEERPPKRPASRKPSS